MENESNSYGQARLLQFRDEPLQSTFNCFLKRSFDVTISLIVIIFILSWLIPLFCLLIKLTSKGPVFFIQERTGKDGQKFKMYKFRSMYVNDESDTKAAEHNDPRITPIGKFMRLTHIDEFPQFIHALTGKMSIVGPRPHMTLHTEEYSQQIPHFMVRHAVKPGITGLAQVNGFRGAIKSLDDMKGRVENDIWYIENWSLWIDLKVVFRTFVIIFKAIGKHR